MRLILAIENYTSLPDGGPLTYTVSGKRGIDIGRDQHLDFVLPDARRYISGKHCEVRYSDGAYLLFDSSTNGTFINSVEHRMQSPHRLRTGDRLLIGDYIIAVTVEEDAAEEQVAPHPLSAPNDDLWIVDTGVAPPIDKKELRAPGPPRDGDFLDRPFDLRPPLRTDPFVAATPRLAIPDASDAGVPIAKRPPAHPDEIDWVVSKPAKLAEPVAGPAKAPATPNDGEENKAAKNDRSAMPAPEQLSLEKELLARFAARVGLPDNFFADVDPGAKIDEIADILRFVVQEVMQLLSARGEAKRLTRNPHQTMMQPVDNNPLKFSPTAEESLRLMLGPRSTSYLDGLQALKQSFAALKSHQLNSYSAMQAAMRTIAEDLDPKGIDQSIPQDRGISGLVSSRRARLWDAYVARWHALTKRHEDGLIDVFMLYFADCYNRIGSGDN